MRRVSAIDYGDPQAPDRWWERIYPEPNTGCWLWAGGDSTKGYGRCRHLSERWLIHRFMYVLGFGQVPEGLELDHLCRVRRCVNPDHLEAVTHAENMRRGANSQPQCIRGHDRPSGLGDCLDCVRVRRARPEYVARKRATDRDYAERRKSDPELLERRRRSAREWSRRNKAAKT